MVCDHLRVRIKRRMRIALIGRSVGAQNSPADAVRIVPKRLGPPCTPLLHFSHHCREKARLSVWRDIPPRLGNPDGPVAIAAGYDKLPQLLNFLGSPARR